MLDELIKNELALLKADLKKGDEIHIDISGRGVEIKTSVKTGEARIRFMQKIQQLLSESKITTSEATMATQAFGKKTKTLFWIK